MARNFVRETFTVGTTWTPPAGVSQVTARAIKYGRLIRTANQLIDPFGNAYAWGAGASGQLGLGDVTPRSSPVAVLGGLQFSSLVTINGSSTAGLNLFGKAYAWGLNSFGELGVGDVTPRSSPVAVLGGLSFQSLSIDNSNTGSPENLFGLTPRGALYGWGRNDSGQLGVGDVAAKSSPVAVLGGLLFQKVTTGLLSTLALSTSGILYGMGSNFPSGQLGVGDVTSRSSPVAVLGGLTFIDAGIFMSNFSGSPTYTSYGITSSNDAYMWGSNPSGSLGVGDVTVRSSPVAVLGGIKFSKLVADGVSTAKLSVVGLATDGRAYAWGDNVNGQLGVGDVTSRSSPVAVLGGLTFVDIFSAQGNYFFGLTADGTLYAWGSNGNGILGVGDTTPRSSPVAVLGGLKFALVQATGASNLGITQDGIAYAWGGNTNGQLGVGDVTSRSSPTAVLGNLLANVVPQTQATNVAVVPGVSIPISFLPFYASVGNVPISSFKADLISLEYFA